MIDFRPVFNRAIAHKSKLDNYRKDYADNLGKIDKLAGELGYLNALYKDTEYAYTYLEKLINLESNKFIRKIQDLITFALKIIFYDCDYSCDIRVTDKNNATIHLVYEDEDGNVVDPNIKSCGMGIRTVVGVVLQTFFIMHYGAEPIIFVDEGFSAISSSYMPYFMAFLDELVEQKDLKLLLVTHDSRLEAYAKKIYKIDKGRSILVKDTTAVAAVNP